MMMKMSDRSLTLSLTPNDMSVNTYFEVSKFAKSGSTDKGVVVSL